MAQPLSDLVAFRMPLDVLEGVDQVAAILDRKRSWIIVRALRAYLAGEGQYLVDLEAAHSGRDGPTVDMQELIDELSEDIAEHRAAE